MSDEVLLVNRDGPVVELTLNRPKVMNAMNQALVARLTEVMKTLETDKDLRAIILTGNGRAFSAGVDLKELSEKPGAIEDMKWYGDDSVFDLMRRSQIPMIAAINGVAVTGGLELAMMSDFMIASDAARFADTHARVGITPSWGMTQVLPLLIGINRARQMSLTGEFVSAQKACDWGLVNEVVPADQLMTRARALAAQIAETDHVTMSRLRTLINASAETTLSEGLACEVELFDTHLAGVTPDQVGTNRAKVTERGRKIAGTGEQA
ncbi:MAG: enoyl-CoA hydratase [Paracoccaceae bacterium]